jgi:polysaccharide export outer membrane protein
MRRILLAMVLVGLAWLPEARAQDAPAEPASSPEYQIGADDVIQVQVWQRPNLSGVFVVDDQGRVNIPLVGSVQALGKTAVELGQDLERRMVILDPGISQVLVTVTAFNSMRFTVVGEVRAPGTYSFRKLPALWDLILRAGGETPGADMSQVQVVRELTPGGDPETITVDLSNGLDGTPPEVMPELRANDSVVVPALEANAVSGDRIQVLGSVRNPGLYPLRVAGSVVEAISVSGGYLPGAKLDQVRVTRRTEGGAVVYNVNLDEYLKVGYPGADLTLKPGDTVSIPSPRGGFSSVFQTVLQVSGLITAVASLVIASDRLR